jgi:AcrR family transcriptional regulator
MPYPTQVTSERIVQAAGDIIEREGVENLSLAQLAGVLGVKAPSLYRYFPSKAALLHAINIDTLAALTDTQGSINDSPEDALLSLTRIASAYRRYAHAHPHRYMLLFTIPTPDDSETREKLVQLALPLQRLISLLTGEDRSLNAIRGLWALIHGYIVLELNGAFQRGGSLDAGFEDAVKTYLAGLSS